MKIILLLIILLFFPAATFAAKPLTITCEPSKNKCSTFGSSPIFSESNIYPGFTQSVSTIVSLVNLDASQSCQVGLLASGASSSDVIAKELIISVGTPQGWLFKGPLFSLLTNPSPPLGTLPPNTSVDYSFLSSLPLTAGNQLQGKTLKVSFDFTFTCQPSVQVEGKVLGQSVTKTSSRLWFYSFVPVFGLLIFVLFKRQKRKVPIKD